MVEVLAVILTALLSFMVADYTLGRAQVKDQLRIAISAVFAVLLVVVAGVVILKDVVN